MLHGPTAHGAGLVGIRERARILGGQAEIQSSAETGTTVAVTLPLGGADAWMTKIRIVIAEDHPSSATGSGACWTRPPPSTSSEKPSDGVTALEHIRSLKPEIAILDIGLPQDERFRRRPRASGRARSRRGRLPHDSRRRGHVRGGAPARGQGLPAEGLHRTRSSSHASGRWQRVSTTRALR